MLQVDFKNRNTTTINPMYSVRLFSLLLGFTFGIVSGFRFSCPDVVAVLLPAVLLCRRWFGLLPHNAISSLYAK